MSLAARILPRGALVVVSLLFAARLDNWIVGALLTALVLGSLFVRRGLTLARPGQLLLLAAGLALVWPTLEALVPAGSGNVSRFATGVSLVGLMLALPRRYLAAPLAGERGTAALHLLVLMGCSQGSHIWTYAAFIVLFGVVQLAALRAVDTGRVPLRLLSTRHRLVLAGMVFIICAAGTGLALSIPPAQSWAMRTFFHAFIKGRTGFSSGMDLGSMDEMYQSDQMVLRVFGPKPDHLRGTVFTRYGSGRWLEARGASTSQDTGLPPGQRVAPEARTRVVTVGGDPRRYFIPLRARVIATGLGQAQVNAMGILTTPPGEEASEASFLPGRRERFALGQPGKDDLQVPREIAAKLRDLVGEWGVGKGTPAQRLAVLEGYLQRNFTYSLSFERKPDKDPLLDFLTRNKEGHCEYFASAMALLARTVGVPARVVGGYRVREFNALGEYYVVRERNAHSWVEAWVPGQGWQTYDPTPPAALAQSSKEKTSTMGALVDLAAARLRAAWEWITRLTFLQLGGAAAGLGVLWAMVRILRRRRWARAEVTANMPLTYRDPFPALERMLAAMASQGIPRRPAEPLESYAQRLAQEEPAPSATVSLLRRYAAWRFGGKGDPGTLAQEMEQLAGPQSGR